MACLGTNAGDPFRDIDLNAGETAHGSDWTTAMANSGLPVTLVEPATCVIRVRGVLSPDWSVRLGGMRIMTMRRSDRVVTELVGRLADQAALHGVLSALYELGMPLIS